MKKIEHQTNFTPEEEFEATKEIAIKGYKQSIGKEYDEVLMKRYIPVEIYMDTDDIEALETVNTAVREVLETMDVEIATKPEIFKGSIIEKFWTVTKSVVSNIDLIKKVAEAIKSFRLNKKDPFLSTKETIKTPDLKLQDLLKHLKDVPNISIRIGTLLITKSTTRDIPSIQAKHLSREDAIILDSNPSLLRNPRTIHNKLNNIKKTILLNKGIAMNI